MAQGEKSKRALGRGFSSLLPKSPTSGKETKDKQNDASKDASGVRMVAINQINPDAKQPRKNFDVTALNELAHSIAAKGIIQPLLVQPDQNGASFTLIAGERRLRAAKQVGLREVPVVIRHANTQERLELALIENIQRQDLSPVEEAKAFHDLTETYGLTHEDIAKRLGRSRSAITNTLRLLKLPAKVQELLSSGALTAGQARPLLSLNSYAEIEKRAFEIISGGLSARQVESKLSKPKESQVKKSKSASVRALEERLQRHFGTRVSVDEDKGRGKVSVYFYSLEELNRILEVTGAN